MAGLPLGLIWNGTQYFYLTNQMGDVIAIADTQGYAIVEYDYDEWGTLDSLYTPDDSEEQLALANINPLRYRGYYFDNETGYYYLQSRYYDSNICRFINADISEIAQLSKGIPTGANLFAYCNNDAVNNSDPTGYSSNKYKVYSYIWGDCTSDSPDLVNIYLYMDNNFIVNAKVSYWKVYNGKTFSGYMAQFDNRKSYAKRTSDYYLFYPLAQAIHYVMTIRYGTSKFKGRTVNGVFVELVLHYALYSLGIQRNSHTNTTEMGGTNTDGNAKYFETLAKGPNVISDLKKGNKAVIRGLAIKAKRKA